MLYCKCCHRSNRWWAHLMMSLASGYRTGLGRGISAARLQTSRGWGYGGTGRYVKAKTFTCTLDILRSYLKNDFCICLQVDSTHYPNWKGLIEHLHAENITVLTYINALLSDVSERGTPFQHNYWQEAMDNDYFVKDVSGDVWVGYTKASLVDLSNPSAYSWYKEIIIQVTSLFICYEHIIIR